MAEAKNKQQPHSFKRKPYPGKIYGWDYSDGGKPASHLSNGCAGKKVSLSLPEREPIEKFLLWGKDIIRFRNIVYWR